MRPKLSSPATSSSRQAAGRAELVGGQAGAGDDRRCRGRGGSAVGALVSPVRGPDPCAGPPPRRRGSRSGRARFAGLTAAVPSRWRRPDGPGGAGGAVPAGPLAWRDGVAAALASVARRAGSALATSRGAVASLPARRRSSRPRRRPASPRRAWASSGERVPRVATHRRGCGPWPPRRPSSAARGRRRMSRRRGDAAAAAWAGSADLPFGRSDPGSSSRSPSASRSRITFRGRKCSRCWRSTQRRRSTSCSKNLPVPRRRALGVDQALALEEPDLRDRDVGELLPQQGQDVTDGEVGAAGHSLPATR